MSALLVLLRSGIAVAFFLIPHSHAIAETLVERGKYLANTIGACGNCHTPKTVFGKPVASRKFAGGTKMRGKTYTAYASNITQDRETGIGNWTDIQIIRAMREGKRPNGETIGPPMPIELYRKLSDRDVRSIVAYLRTIKPRRNKVPKSIYRTPLPASYGPPVKRVGEVSRKDSISYGAYLAGPVGHCTLCHTPVIRGRADWSRIGAGGQEFILPFGVVVSSNITAHKDDGIGSWSDDEIARAIQRGINRDDTRLNPPMPYAWYRGITKADIAAIIAYLRTLKARETP